MRRSPVRAQMSLGFAVSEQGIHIRTLSRNQTFAWSQIATCLAARDHFSIMYREPAHASGFGSARLSHRHARQVLETPWFPRATLSRRGAEFLGLSASQASTFGPPTETRWAEPGPDQGVSKALRSKLPRPHSSFLVAKRVGAWPGGVEFDFGDSPLHEPGERTLPWDLLDPWTTPAMDSCFQFGWPVGRGWPVGQPSHIEQWLVTVAQARFLLGFSSNRVWDLTEEVRRSLGMP